MKQAMKRSVGTEKKSDKGQSFTPDEARQMLEQFVDRLEAHMEEWPYGEMFAPDNARWMIDGIREHLAKGTSLDSALHLKRHRGQRKEKIGKHFDVALKVHALLQARPRPSWGKIASDIGWEQDIKELKAAYARAQSELFSRLIEKIATRLKSGD